MALRLPLAAAGCLVRGGGFANGREVCPEFLTGSSTYSMQQSRRREMRAVIVEDCQGRKQLCPRLLASKIEMHLINEGERAFGACCFGGLEDCTSISCKQPKRVQVEARVGPGTGLQVVRDEEWEAQMRRETAERDAERQKEKEVEVEKENVYRSLSDQLKGYPGEKLKEAKKFVASLIKAGEGLEQMIVEAADNGELTPIILLVIKNRLELARHDDERDAIQALDLLYRRVEAEILRREAPLALLLLDELLNLHDGFSREEWLRRSRITMQKVFPPEDAFTFLGGPNFDLYKHHGPIEMPEEDDVLLRIDFIREVKELLSELEAQREIKPVQGFDAESIAIRLRQEERLRSIELVRELLKLAVNLKW